MTPGRKPSIRTSARSTSSRTTSTRARVLEVERHGGPAATEEVLGGRHHETGAAGPVDADDVRAEIGQQHAGEGAGPDPDELDDRTPCSGPVRCCGHSPIVTVALSRLEVTPVTYYRYGYVSSSVSRSGKEPHDDSTRVHPQRLRRASPADPWHRAPPAGVGPRVRPARESYDVIAIDLAGFGESEPYPDGTAYTMDNACRIIGENLQAWGVSDPTSSATRSAARSRSRWVPAAWPAPSPR